MADVLSGARVSFRSQSPFRDAVVIWLPVLVMLTVIARESTEQFSGLHTSAVLRPIWEGLFGATTDLQWSNTHHVLRKSGHFLGYGTLGVSWLRGWLLQWLVPFRLRPAAIWHRWSFQMAIASTALVASLDELHQTFLPGRTGVMQDVLLDTLGAVVLCATIASFWPRKG